MMAGRSGRVRALVRGEGGPRLAEVERRAPGPGEAAVRVELAGICRTDMYAAEGKLGVQPGRVLGHEFVGIVEEVGEHVGLRPGVRVTAAPRVACGQCAPCRKGMGDCPYTQMLGVELDGAFAERVVLPASALHEVPAAMPARRAAYTEPLAAALAVFEAPIEPGQQGVLLGDNRIAELTMRLLRARGFERVARAARPEELPSHHFLFGIETAATTASIRALMDAVIPGGCVVLKSRPPEPIAFDVAMAVRKSLRFHAVDYGSFGEAIELLDRLDVDDLLGDVFPMSRYAEAFELARRSEARKLFLEP